MARFYATLQGNRGAVSRLGHTDITAHVRGWNVGVRVHGGASYSHPNADVFHVFATAGSNGASSDVLIGTVRLDDHGRPTFYPVEDANQ